MRILMGLLAGVAGLLTAAATNQAQAKKDISPDADAAVRRMSNFLGGQPNISVVSDSAEEVVRPSGEKLQFNARSHLTVARPNKLRSDRISSKVDLSFFYDGKQYAIYGKRANAYATTPAPATLDQAIDDVRDRLGLDAPGGDLLFTNSYAGLMDGVRAGQDLGPDVVNGVSCRHLAFQKADVDFQLWIQESDKPLPCKYVITSKKEKGAPQFEVTLTDWQLGQSPPSDTFKFDPPEGAEHIEFMAPPADQRSPSGS